MHTTFVIKAEDIDEKLLKGIKNSYKDKQIEITVRELDETEYLLKNENNKKRLLKAVKNSKLKKNLTEVNLKKLKKNK
jgi:antitoxin YefM